MNYPDQLRDWRARRRAIVDHYRQSCSLRATGQAFGISGERVRQIVKQEAPQAADTSIMIEGGRPVRLRARKEGKDASLPEDREVLGGNRLHGEGDPPQD